MEEQKTIMADIDFDFNDISAIMKDERRLAIQNLLKEPFGQDNFVFENICDKERKRIEGLHFQVMKSTLGEYLRRTPPQTRVRAQFGSKSLYPSEEMKAIIQGTVTASLNLMKSGKSCRNLLHPDNVILKHQGYHPYPDYVFENIIGDQTIVQNMVRLREAGLIAAPTVGISFIHDMKKNLMGDMIVDLRDDMIVDLRDDMIVNLRDDMKALEHLIFRDIIAIDENDLLPPDWQNFRSLILNSSPVNYLLIATHPCLWDTKKTLKYFGFLDDCYYKSTPFVRKLVVDSLENMQIFQTDWLSNLNTEKELVEFRDRNIPEKGYKMDRVYCLITFFRNLTEHLHERVNVKSQYKNVAYLVYKLGVLFPNLLGEIHGRLLPVGFLY